MRRQYRHSPPGGSKCSCVRLSTRGFILLPESKSCTCVTEALLPISVFRCHYCSPFASSASWPITSTQRKCSRISPDSNVDPQELGRDQPAQTWRKIPRNATGQNKNTDCFQVCELVCVFCSWKQTKTRRKASSRPRGGDTSDDICQDDVIVYYGGCM